MAKKEWTPEEKAQFAENAQRKADAAAELLTKGVEQIFTSGKYEEFLKFYSGFHQYSLGNTLLIMLQLPGASHCASFPDWKKRGRFVKRGEKGLMIRVPTPKKWTSVDEETGEEEEHMKMYWKVGTVFDISQTDGEDLPELAHKLTSSVDRFPELFQAVSNAAGIPISVEDITGSASGYYSIAENRIVVREGMSEAQTLKTLIHETAHSILHRKGGEQERADRQTQELQAESVAFVVCNMLGLDTSDYSFGYVAGWSHGKSVKHLERNLNIIGKTAEEIFKKIEA